MTFDVILEAAAQVFDTEGISATTNRIAERAGVSIGTIYQYFPDKHALIHELALRHLADVGKALEAVIERSRAEGSTLADLVTDVAMTMAQVNHSPGQLYQVLREHAPHSQQLTALFAETASTIARVLADRLEGLGVSNATDRTRLALEALDGQVHGSLTRTSRTAGPDSTRLELVIAHQLAIFGQAHEPTSE